MLRKMETQEDNALLEKELARNRRNAVIVRLGEKRVLREALLWLRAEEEQESKEDIMEKDKRKRKNDGGDKGEKTGKTKKARR